MKTLFNKPLAIIAFSEFKGNMRDKWLLVYGFSFLLFGGLITYLGSADPLQASASLLNLVLLIVPLFTLVFGSISFSESLPFCEILVSLPISRGDIYWGKWIGLGSGLSLSFLVGMGLGSMLQMNVAEQGFGSYFLLLFLGVLLTLVFLSLAFLMSTLIKRREMVFGIILLLWFAFFVVYDVLVIGIVLEFGDYPLEWPMMGLVLLNPIDLVRVILLLHIDLSAMMGYSGALFQKYFSHYQGIFITSLVLCLWIAIPFWFGFRAFNKKDL